MKHHWKPQVMPQQELKPVLEIVPKILEIPKAAESPKVEAPTFFGCILCSSQAGVLYDGTSYCRSCLKEKLRLGR